jgi:hypothetical protein
LLLVTGACMTPAPAPGGGEQVPVHGGGTGYICDAGKAGSLTGQPATSEVGSRALSMTGARTVRWIRPGAIVTMDYREDRLNIELDARNRVTRLSCG